MVQESGRRLGSGVPAGRRRMLEPGPEKLVSISKGLWGDSASITATVSLQRLLRGQRI